MNMSFNQLSAEKTLPAGSAPSLVTVFQYRPTPQETEILAQGQPEKLQVSEVRLAEEVLAQRLDEARAQGSAETEARMQRDHERALVQERNRITESIRSFELTRREYFAEVEGELVQLALSIARKILHREAQVDPLLMTALVQVALMQMKEGSAVAVRVPPEEAPRWREQLGAPAFNLEVTVIEDSDCGPGDCVLETELGRVNFSLKAQLKEVEVGFLDVLARKPPF